MDYIVQSAVGNFTDGYNIDFEAPLQPSQAEKLTDMVKLIKDSFTKALPHSQVNRPHPGPHPLSNDSILTGTLACWGVGKTPTHFFSDLKRRNIFIMW